jgi:hypothetical protein
VSQKTKQNKTSWAPVAHTYNSSYSGGRDLETLSQNYLTYKQGWQSGTSDRVPTYKCKALSSNPSTTTKKKLRKNLKYPKEGK